MRIYNSKDILNGAVYMNVITIKKSEKKSTYQRKLRQLKSAGIDAYKYCGKILIPASAQDIQKKLRNEWK